MDPYVCAPHSRLFIMKLERISTSSIECRVGALIPNNRCILMKNLRVLISLRFGQCFQASKKTVESLVPFNIQIYELVNHVLMILLMILFLLQKFNSKVKNLSNLYFDLKELIILQLHLCNLIF